MAKGKPPAFLFYPDAWLSSTDIMLMTAEEERGYLRLLCHQWLNPDCSIEDSDSVLARLSLLGGAWPASKPKLMAKFEVKDGRIFNDRLREERQKRDEWVKKSSRAGKKSAKARATKSQPTPQPNLNQDINQSPTNLEPNSQPNANTRIENEIVFISGEMDTLTASSQLLNLAHSLSDETYDVSEDELANVLSDIHPSPSVFGDVVGAISQEFYRSPTIPRARVAQKMIASLQSWAAYWEADSRFATGLAKWIKSGDWARRAPASKKARMARPVLSALPTAADLSRRAEELRIQDTKDSEARLRAAGVDIEALQ